MTKRKREKDGRVDLVALARWTEAEGKRLGQRMALQGVTADEFEAMIAPDNSDIEPLLALQYLRDREKRGLR